MSNSLSIDHFLKSVCVHGLLLLGVLTSSLLLKSHGVPNSKGLEVNWVELPAGKSEAVALAQSEVLESEPAEPVAMEVPVEPSQTNHQKVLPQKTVVTRSEASNVSAPISHVPRVSQSVGHATGQVAHSSGGAQSLGGEEAGVPSVRDRYFAEVRALIEREKFYPSTAKALRQVGVVEVSFSIQKDGTIQSVELAKASPFSQLNRAGIEILKRISRFKPIPVEIAQSSLRLTVPIQYELR